MTHSSGDRLTESPKHPIPSEHENNPLWATTVNPFSYLSDILFSYSVTAAKSSDATRIFLVSSRNASELCSKERFIAACIFINVRRLILSGFSYRGM